MWIPAVICKIAIIAIDSNFVNDFSNLMDKSIKNEKLKLILIDMHQNVGKDYLMRQSWSSSNSLFFTGIFFRL